jgi:hypothetical protein
MTEPVTMPFRLESYTANPSSSTRTDGILRLENDALVIECRTSTLNLRTLETESGDVTEVRIPLDLIEGIEMGRRWPWGARLRILTRTLSALKDVPHAAGNELVVRVRRSDFQRARSFCVSTTLELSNREIRRLEGKADD